MGKTSKDKRDIYYRMAKEEGFRARSAFKLLQLDETYHIFNGVRRVVDLCAAPGSWSQVLSKKIYMVASSEEQKNVKIVAVDLQEMSPLPGVVQIKGDITEEMTAEAVIAQFNGQKAQLMLCDGAPDVTGLHSQDEVLQSQLVNAAFNISTLILEEGGTFVSKIFRAKHIDLTFAQMRLFFKEAFIVCRKYAPPEGYVASLKNSLSKFVDYDEALKGLTGVNRAIVPFMANGDMSGMDSERTYKLVKTILGSFQSSTNDDKEDSDNKNADGYEYLSAVQPPIKPPYAKAKNLQLLTKLAEADGVSVDQLTAESAKITPDNGETAINILLQFALESFSLDSTD